MLRGEVSDRAGEGGILTPGQTGVLEPNAVAVGPRFHPEAAARDEQAGEQPKSGEDGERQHPAAAGVALPDAFRG